MAHARSRARAHARAQVTTILFDCDNTLVLSEELAFAGCADLVNGIVKKHNLPVEPFTGESLQEQYVGSNFRGMLESLMRDHDTTIAPDELDGLVMQEEDVVIARLRAELQPCHGVAEVLSTLVAERPDLTLAVVSSSAERRVQVSLDKTGLAQYFKPGRIYSAATSLSPPTSKPDPAVYLYALKDLGKTAKESVAIEDSKSGTTSAVRAGIPTVGYVGAYHPSDREDMRQVLRAAGAFVIMEEWSDWPACWREIQRAAAGR